MGQDSIASRTNCRKGGGRVNRFFQLWGEGWAQRLCFRLGGKEATARPKRQDRKAEGAGGLEDQSATQNGWRQGPAGREAGREGWCTQPHQQAVSSSVSGQPEDSWTRWVAVAQEERGGMGQAHHFREEQGKRRWADRQEHRWLSAKKLSSPQAP